MPIALFGITNDTANLVVNLLVLCAAAASFVFPYLGTIVYSILRPPEFIEDQRERDLEIKAAELRLRQLE